jgi:hypothetical protein
VLLAYKPPFFHLSAVRLSLRTPLQLMEIHFFNVEWLPPDIKYHLTTVTKIFFMHAHISLRSSSLIQDLYINYFKRFPESREEEDDPGGLKHRQVSRHCLTGSLSGFSVGLLSFLSLYCFVFHYCVVTRPNKT